jgi:hypothetical protein
VTDLPRPTLLCVGIAVVDVVAHANGALVPGVKQFADRIVTTYGGPATTAAAAAARLGVTVELVAAVGDDERGVLRCAPRSDGTGSAPSCCSRAQEWGPRRRWSSSRPTASGPS